MDVNEITIRKNSWQKLASILGDTNPIHYDGYENYGYGPICPGIYLYSLAESEVRENEIFKLPIKISAIFLKPVFDNEILSLQKECLNLDDERKSFRLIFNSKEHTVAKVEFNEISQKNFNYDYFDNFKYETYGINREKLDIFNETLEIKNNDQIYSAFILGGVLKNFLNGREGSLLHEMEFEFYEPLSLSDITNYIEIKEKLKSENKKIKRLEYTILSKAMQNGVVMSIGRGVAMNKLIKD